jgi:hypothetical protein
VLVVDAAAAPWADHRDSFDHDPDRCGQEQAVTVLAGVDDYYLDRSGQHDSVLTALVQR